jgi:exopolyphosphatase / guanosine-5'-triphosphate,3'-diphosphate pyrophosphatase
MARDLHRVGVVDIGSNSTRLLIADVGPGEVVEIERRSTVTRLGRGVDLSEQLAGEAIEAACAAIDSYMSLCREAGVESYEAIATSAVRDAANGGAFIAELRERFALSARVLDGEEEARLTYVGATFEGPPSEPTVVIDIGGGSTEFVAGTGEEIAFYASLQVGVVRHTERHISSDPPTALELEELAADVRSSIQDAVAAEPDAHATAGIAVAGTPTSLAAIELGLVPYDPASVHSHRLSLPTIQHLLSQLASVPLAERAEIPGLQPDRAPTIVAGVVILVETMRAFGLNRVTVSERDILYGTALSALTALDRG